MNQELSSKLATLTDTALQSAIWQVRFWIPLELLFECSWVIATLWFLRKCIKDKEKWVDEDMAPLVVGVNVATIIVSLVVIMVGIPNTLSAIWNPVFWAIKEYVNK